MRWERLPNLEEQVVFLVALLPDGGTQWLPLVRKKPTTLWIGWGRLECALGRVGTCRAGLRTE